MIEPFLSDTDLARIGNGEVRVAADFAHRFLSRPGGRTQVVAVVSQALGPRQRPDAN